MSKKELRLSVFELEKLGISLVIPQRRELEAEVNSHRVAAVFNYPHDTVETNSELLNAAMDVIERWDSPLWKDLPATAEYIERLRQAVAKAQKEAQ